jgi:penicillin-binding protein 2
MWGVVNGGGTAGSIRIPGFEIAGKTGTAQVAELGKDVGGNKDHAWFVSFAPAFKPEIAVIALIENSGFGGANAAPAAKGVYEAYLVKKGFVPPADPNLVAKR